MPQFKKYKLGELVTFQRGHDLTINNIVKGKYPVAGSNGPIGYHNKFTTKGPSLTLGRSGNSIGVAHYYENDFWAHNTTLYGKEFHNANPKFIYYLLKTIDFNNHNSGSAVPSLNRNYINPFEVEAPDLPTQTRIASILSSLDDKIELNMRTNHTLEQIAQALFKKYFADDIDPENLPEGWRWGTVGEICNYNQNTLSKNDKLDWISYVEISEVNKGYIGNIARYKRGTEPSRARRILKHGDSVLSTVRPDRGSYFLAINPERGLLVSTGFAVFTTTEVPYSFIYLFLTQEENINYYGFMAHGAAYPAINPEIILKMEIVIPPKAVLTDFHSKAESLLLKFHSNTVESNYLAQLRDTLLPKLMSGEIEVNVAEKELADI